MKKVGFLFVIFILILIPLAGCIRPLEVSPQSRVIENVMIKVEIIKDVKWYNLAQDIMVLNLEVVNNSNSEIMIYPLSKSFIIDATGRQYFPVREFYYQPKIEPSLSFEFSFKTNEPPSFSISFRSNTQSEKEILELLKAYELMKFRDGKVFPGARVSGILIFYIPKCKFPARLIIPEVLWELSLQKYDFEFILTR
ncbi:MAG: hypothetical protein ACK4SU_00660 [Dictyoglomus sp.]